MLHLPVVGGGDGGIYSTAADLRSFWDALFAGRIVPEAWVGRWCGHAATCRRRAKRYGLGFWLHPTSEVVMIEGYDAGVSFRSMHDPVSGASATVIANTSEGAWPFVELLEEYLAT